MTESVVKDVIRTLDVGMAARNSEYKRASEFFTKFSDAIDKLGPVQLVLGSAAERHRCWWRRCFASAWRPPRWTRRCEH